MLLLRVIDHRGTVAEHVVTTFPFHIGRSSNADLRIDAPGTWDSHAVISLEENEKFLIRAEGSALLLVNDEPAVEHVLAPGDEVSLGSARILTSLSPPRQRTLVASEVGVWCLLLLVAFIEAAFIFLLS